MGGPAGGGHPADRGHGHGLSGGGARRGAGACPRRGRHAGGGAARAHTRRRGGGRRRGARRGAGRDRGPRLPPAGGELGRRVLGQRAGRAEPHPRGARGPLGRQPVLGQRSEHAGQDLHTHRWLHHRLRLRAAGVPHPAQGRAGRGPGPTAGPRGRARRAARRGAGPRRQRRPEPHRGHPRQLDGWGDEGLLRASGALPGRAQGARRDRGLRGAAGRSAGGHPRHPRGQGEGGSAADHRGLDARRAVQRDRWTGGQRLRSGRPELHDRCGVRQLHGGPPVGREGPPGPRLRLRGHRRCGSLDGPRHLHQVLQDRRAVARSFGTLRRVGERLRDGRGRRHPGAEAPVGRRGRRRPHLRGDPRHRGQLRRQGQGHHRAEHRGPEARPASCLRRRRTGPGRGRPRGVSRHLHGRGRQGRGGGAQRGRGRRSAR